MKRFFAAVVATVCAFGLVACRDDGKADASCKNVPKIVIPSSVIEIGYYAFSNCDGATFYCRATSRPSGRNEQWRGFESTINPRPIVWGYSGA